MTPDGQNEREPRNRGRRKADQWTMARIIEMGAVIGLLYSGYTAISAYFAARWATRNEVGQVVEKVDSLATNVDSLRAQANRRFQSVELKQLEAEKVHDLLPAYFRMQCIMLERDRSTTLSDAAGFPCDSLLRRRR